MYLGTVLLIIAFFVILYALYEMMKYIELNARPMRLKCLSCSWEGFADDASIKFDGNGYIVEPTILWPEYSILLYACPKCNGQVQRVR